MGAKLNLVGKKFGRLLVLSESKHKKGRANWLCQCDCGKKHIVESRNLNYGSIQSCGCLHLDVVSKNSTTHGMSATRFYNIWKGMKRRCLNKNAPFYKYYGERGIKLLWNSFQEFKNDMYKSYLNHIKKFGEKQTTIDRIDNNGNYCKANCRWATLQEQTENKSKTRSIETRKKMSIAAKERIKKFPYTSPSNLKGRSRKVFETERFTKQI